MTDVLPATLAAFDYNLFWDGGAVEMSAPSVTRAQTSDYGIPVVEAGAYEAEDRVRHRWWGRRVDRSSS